jgi:RND superfamily putative drug exporter
MFSVFASFVGTHDASLKTIAFGLVPAVLALLGEKSWWLPRHLDRALPNLDVETAALQDAPHQM